MPIVINPDPSQESHEGKKQEWNPRVNWFTELSKKIGSLFSYDLSERLRTRQLDAKIRSPLELDIEQYTSMKTLTLRNSHTENCPLPADSVCVPSLLFYVRRLAITYNPLTLADVSVFVHLYPMLSVGQQPQFDLTSEPLLLALRTVWIESLRLFLFSRCKILYSNISFPFVTPIYPFPLYCRKRKVKENGHERLVAD